MKQLIGFVRLGILSAFSPALCSAHPETQATETSNRQALPQGGELVWRAIDGTVIAREVNLATHAS